MKPPATISELRHRLALCRADDVVVDGSISLRRTNAATMWAKIEAKRGQLFVDGRPVFDDRERASHRIVVRARQDLAITAAAWIYEDRGASPPRWFKVLSTGESEHDGRWWIFDARLVEASDFAAAPAAPAEAPVLSPVTMPKGVAL